ncbi:MAG: hemerythrin [Bacteriovoracaceae bacterium]|nr:hemerythrin [Bacteriovoracaceae bacterium]
MATAKSEHKTTDLNVFEKLSKDHRKVESLFKKLLVTDDEDTERESIFNDIYRELEAHTQAEEKLFYPRTEESDMTHYLTLEAYEEHRLVKQLLDELKDADKNTEEWCAKAEVLSELFKLHVREEEDEIFPKAKKVIMKDESIDLAQEVEKEEESVKHSLEAA